MPTYVSLISWTQQGIANVKQTLDRLETAKRGARSLGAEIKAAYYTMGRYDVVAIVEAPDDETASRFALATGMLGSVRTETLRAYTPEEFAKILRGLP